MSNKNILFLIVLLFILSSCKKDKIDFTAEPTIEFVSISPSSATQYTDQVTITLHYEDGDGDLGENNDGVKNCFVTDNRIGITYQYRIQQLAPSGTAVPISGNLNVDIGGQIITDSTSQQSVTYSVYLVDRAGHASNTVVTSAITVVR